MLLLLLACAPEAPPAPADPLDAAWIGKVVAEPAAFTTAVDPAREGWIALHSHDFAKARAAGGAPAARACAELSALHADLERTQLEAWKRLIAGWEKRGSIPPEMYLGAGIAHLDAGDKAGSTALFEKARGSADADVRAAAEALARSADLSQPVTGAGPILERVNAHVAARVSGQLDGVREGPLWAQESRVVVDPLVHGTRRAIFAACAAPLQGMDRQLFSTCGDDACAEINLGLPALSAEDDADSALGLARALDTRLDAWEKLKIANASPDASALLADLRLVPRLRAEVLLAHARLVVASHPRQALALVQHALDFQSPREIGPVNHPGLYALAAEANLRTGHTREALDALQVLVGSYPEAGALDALVEDLSVLEGLDRLGDSKEN